MGQMVRRPLHQREAACRGKSGLHGRTVPANGRRGQPQGKCHRNQTAQRAFGLWVRMKRRGKSAPPGRQRSGHGKPHQEQDRIGVTRHVERDEGPLRPVTRVGCKRCDVSRAQDEWSPRLSGQNPAYRPSDPPLIVNARARLNTVKREQIKNK